eukprot:scaffold3058_cov65-Phaeocystis_antarctica.AAC.4
MSTGGAALRTASLPAPGACGGGASGRLRGQLGGLELSLRMLPSLPGFSNLPDSSRPPTAWRMLPIAPGARLSPGLGLGLVEQGPNNALPAAKVGAQLVSDIRRRADQRRRQSRGPGLSARFGGRRLDRRDRGVEVERVVVVSILRT